MHNYENCEKNLSTLFAISFSRLRIFFCNARVIPVISDQKQLNKSQKPKLPKAIYK